MATIEKYKTKNGTRWMVRWREIEPTTGKSKQHKKKGFTKSTDATLFMAEVIQKTSKGQTVSAKRITVSEWLDIWYNDHVLRSISPTAQESYLGNIKKINSRIGNIELSQLNRHIIQNMYDDLKENGRYDHMKNRPKDKPFDTSLSATTIERINAQFRTALNAAVRDGYISENPTRFIKLPKKEKFIPNFKNVEQISNILSILREEEMYMPILIASTLGIRLGEALGLLWEDINFKENTITICHNWVFDTTKKKMFMKTTKTDISNVKAIPPALKDSLKSEKIRQVEYKLKFGEEYVTTNYDFVCRKINGEPFHSRYYSKDFRKLLKKHNIEHMRFYDLRHSVASILYEGGYSEKFIQEFFGHKKLSTTMNIYTHIFKESKTEAATILDSVIPK